MYKSIYQTIIINESRLQDSNSLGNSRKIEQKNHVEETAFTTCSNERYGNEKGQEMHSNNPTNKTTENLYFRSPTQWSWSQFQNLYPYDQIYNDMLFYKIEAERWKSKYQAEKKYTKKVRDDLSYYKRRYEELKMDRGRTRKNIYHSRNYYH